MYEFQSKKLKILLKLYLSKYDNEKRTTTLANLEKEFGYLPGAPDTRALFRYLIDENILIKNGNLWNNAPLYYMNRKELRKLLDLQETIQLYKKIVIYDIP